MLVLVYVTHVMKNSKVSIAEVLGTNAFKSGRDRNINLDKAALNLLIGVDDTSLIFKKIKYAWYNNYDTAKLKSFEENMEPIMLYNLGSGSVDGVLRLQSQLYINRNTCDFILENGILKSWEHGFKGWDFYPISIPYEIVDDIEKMYKQKL